MPELQMLNLARNRFSGQLPGSFGSKKMENLDLSGNNLSGRIPQSFGKFMELMELKLSENKLSGNIPDELSLCKKLVFLDLSHNQLTGGIPISLSEMPVLSQLDLSVNQLSGEIPSYLGKVESLVQVNISHNNFHGSLPSTGAFLAISSSAVAGNSLCGGETSGLPPCSGIKSRIPWFLIASLLASLVVLVLAVSFAVFIRGRKKLELKRIESEDGTWELQFLNSRVSKSITINDIVSSIKEENLISRGKNRVSYKGKSTTNNTQFLAEEITSFSTKSSTKIIELCNLKHTNIVKLFGICQSEKVGILVYEYIEGKDLHEALPGLSWERRRKVAIGIAKALRYLHCYCSTGILAGDLSPRKIIVDENDEAHLRLSLPGLVSADNKCFISSAYVAPETRASIGMTEKSDIYGFGLVLIELLTGKSPAADGTEFGIHQSIVEWARYCYSDCHLEIWVDPTIKNHAVMNNQNQIVEIMNLALQCTATDPAARPCAIHIVKTLGSAVKSSSCGFELISANV
ncbi:inactive leucine-rich repeat receptor-like protein kinase [Abeliophyllum distichum]|uniref:Inactive leucine-rich repeat receptor-like protein kinase n=1 Tax=Abeliophyllum distichum TaxID=126358 RepID=A0ABD1TYE6_9LAMI